MIAENKRVFCLTRMRQLRIHHIYKGPFLGLFFFPQADNMFLF